MRNSPASNDCILLLTPLLHNLSLKATSARHVSFTNVPSSPLFFSFSSSITSIGISKTQKGHFSSPFHPHPTPTPELSSLIRIRTVSTLNMTTTSPGPSSSSSTTRKRSTNRRSGPNFRSRGQDQAPESLEEATFTSSKASAFDQSDLVSHQPHLDIQPNGAVSGAPDQKEFIPATPASVNRKKKLSLSITRKKKIVKANDHETGDCARHEHDDDNDESTASSSTKIRPSSRKLNSTTSLELNAHTINGATNNENTFCENTSKVSSQPTLINALPKNKDFIYIRGAKQHNLKNVDLDVPKNKLVVFTGVSGSGKSSMAFDTIFSEGRRRYLESFSAYARQMMGNFERPDVQVVENLSPAISIDQSAQSNNPRSTVGTVTEALDYLRLAFGNAADAHCPKCDHLASAQTVDEIVASISKYGSSGTITLLAPIVNGRKGTHLTTLDKLKQEGIVRVRVDHEYHRLDSLPPLDKNKPHTIEAVLDRILWKPHHASVDKRQEIQTRLTDSVRNCLKLSSGLVIAVHESNGQKTTQEHAFSENFGCPVHGPLDVAEFSPRLFSFNAPLGACTNCHGIGMISTFDEYSIVPDSKQTIINAILPFFESGGKKYYQALMANVAKALGLDAKTHIWDSLSQKDQKAILYGSSSLLIEYPTNTDSIFSRFRQSTATKLASWKGVIPMLESQINSQWATNRRERLQRFRIAIKCPQCNGARLNSVALAAKLGGFKWSDIACEIDSETALKRVQEMQDVIVRTNDARKIAIVSSPLREVISRLQLLCDLGLQYLSLDRPAGTLSGGESRRIKLANRLGSSLTGVLYVMDEPSIGLHPRDNHRLLSAIEGLRDHGNSVIVVEHDESTISRADWVVDFGPGAGELGGELIFSGILPDLLKNEKSLTGAYLSGVKRIETPTRRQGKGYIVVENAHANNLKGVNLKVPLGVMTVFTGISGSGKSTLMNAILQPAIVSELQRIAYSKKQKWRSSCSSSTNSTSTSDLSDQGEEDVYKNQVASGTVSYDSISGIEGSIDKLIVMDQSPIGRTPRSNPATYTGAFDDIRSIFANTAEARAKGLKAGDFSFNKKGGRCEACDGQGFTKISMLFLPDVEAPCSVCKGKRYSADILSIKHDGKDIADVLNLTIEEALEHFKKMNKTAVRLQALCDVGLGYMRLGQPAPHLSGGEAQRVKLASELSRRNTGKTIYLIDEPTTGLSFYDVHQLMISLQKLVDLGNTVVIIEHNMDVVRCADWIIDLGPEGGAQGGRIIAEGTPEQVALKKDSRTGIYIKEALKKHPVPKKGEKKVK